MKIINIICPHCGATTKVDPAKKQAVCDSCGKTIDLEDEKTRGINDASKTKAPMVDRIKDYGEGEKEERKIVVLRTITMVLANLTAILSANYIVFYILDHFNQNLHFVVRSDFFLVRYLHYLIPIMTLTTALLYLLLLVVNGFSRRKLRMKRFVMLLAADILLAGIIAMSINIYTFDWFNLRVTNVYEAVATLPPSTPVPPVDTPAPVVTPTPAAEETSAPATPEYTLAPGETPTPTPEPTSEPTPEPTPEPVIPGLLGNAYKEKFSDGDPVVTEPNTVEVLEDGTEKTLIYTYATDKIAVEIFHYQKDKLEYQIAELYVRDIHCLKTNYSDTQGNARTTADFAREINAIAAINSDYFATNAIGEGLIIRDGILIRNQPCKYADLCVIYQDGNVRCFDCKTDEINNDDILNSYPYHSFYFGPSILDEEGHAKTVFNSTLRTYNPRSVFGFYEKGHYAFLCVLGDRGMKDINGHGLGDGKSPGVTLEELSVLCESLGMKAAYNFDGGNSSVLYWNDTVFGHNNRATGDILAVIDG